MPGDRPRAHLPDPVLHELNTALAMLLGFAELLETRTDPRTRKEATSGIVQAAARVRVAVEAITGAPLDGAAPGEAPETSTGSPPSRLLAILEDPSELEVLRAALSADLAELFASSSAEEGLRTLDDTRPDAVLLDWAIAGRTGAETLAELKLRRPDLPVIVLGAGDSKQRHISALLEADGFVARPLDVGDVRRAVLPFVAVSSEHSELLARGTRL